MMRLHFDDKQPDDLGRRSFTVYMTDTDGEWRPEISKHDGCPVGYRRAQCFHAVPPVNFVEVNPKVPWE